MASPCESEPCTGLAATWCPCHGDCTCPTVANTYGDTDRPSMDDPDCPLHGDRSTHATWPAPGHLADIDVEPPTAPTHYRILTNGRATVGIPGWPVAGTGWLPVPPAPDAEPEPCPHPRFAHLVDWAARSHVSCVGCGLSAALPSDVWYETEHGGALAHTRARILGPLATMDAVTFAQLVAPAHHTE